MAITRTIYTQGKVTLKTGIVGGTLSNFAVVSGVQNASFSMETPRENVNSFGFKGLVDKVQVAPETATINFSYILPKHDIEADVYGASANHLSPSKISGLMGDALSDTHSGIHVEVAGIGCIVSGIMSSFSVNASAGDLATVDMTFEGVPSGGSLSQDADTELPTKNSNISTATYDVLTPDRISGYLPDNSLGNDAGTQGDLTKVLYVSDFSADANSFTIGAGTLTPVVTPKNNFATTTNITAGSAVVIVTSTVGLSVGQVLTKISGVGVFGTSPTIVSIDSATQFTVTPVHATSGDVVFSVPFNKPGSWLEVKNATAGVVQLSKNTLPVAGTNLDNYVISFRVFNNSGVLIYANAALDDASAEGEFSNPPISIAIGEDKLISFSSKIFDTDDRLLIRFGPTAGTVNGPTGDLTLVDTASSNYIYIKDIVVSTDGGANNAGNFAGCVQSATFSWEVPIERIQCLGETVSSSTNFSNPPGTSSLTLEGIDIPYPVSGITLGDMRIMLRNAKVVSREHNLAVGDVAATFNLSLEATAMDVSMFPTLTSN